MSSFVCNPPCHSMASTLESFSALASYQTLSCCPARFPYNTTTPAREGLGSYRLPFMLLNDQTSLYVTKPRATNTISLIVILMCHTECLATDLTFHSYSTCFLSVLVFCLYASSRYLPTSLGKRTSSPRDSRAEVNTVSDSTLCQAPNVPESYWSFPICIVLVA